MNFQTGDRVHVYGPGINYRGEAPTLLAYNTVWIIAKMRYDFEDMFLVFPQEDKDKDLNYQRLFLVHPKQCRKLKPTASMKAAESLKARIVVHLQNKANELGEIALPDNKPSACLAFIEELIPWIQML